MTVEKKYVIAEQKNSSRLASYISGFVLSVVLTIATYVLAANHVLSGTSFLVVVLELAIIQFVVQIFLFLHIAEKVSRKWRFVTLFLMMFFVLILVIGSVWIMQQLNYHMSPEKEMQYMQQQKINGF